MLHYIDIHLLPDPEFPERQLLSALYAKLHRVLAQTQLQTIAACFPGYEESARTLGGRLRLIGPAEDLEQLMGQGWLKGMRDHSEVKPMQPVPLNAPHRTLRRVHVKSNPERLRRRLRRRQNLTEQQARERIPGDRGRRSDLPCVSVSSSSTGQQFLMFLKLGPVVEPQAGAFNAYGLSATASIPWF